MAGLSIDKYRRLFGGSRILSALVGVNIAVGVVAILFSAVARLMHSSFDAAAWLALPSGFMAFIHRPWTLLTYMVTHFSLLHLLFNVLWVYWFGLMLVSTGRDRDLLIGYIGGGITGGILYLVASAAGMTAGTYLCGASASVMSVMCLAAVIKPDYELNLLLIGRVKLKWMALICVLLTLLGGGGALSAHIGGVIFGLLYGAALKWDVAKRFVYKKNPRKSRDTKRKRNIAALQNRLNDPKRLDELLDKIRLSGFSSLTDAERHELDALSSRLRKEDSNT